MFGARLNTLVGSNRKLFDPRKPYDATLIYGGRPALGRGVLFCTKSIFVG